MPFPLIDTLEDANLTGYGNAGASLSGGRLATADYVDPFDVGDSSVSIWDWNGSTWVRAFRIYPGAYLGHIRLAADGTKLALTTTSPARELKIYDVGASSATLLQTFTEAGLAISPRLLAYLSLGFSQDGSTIVIAAQSTTGATLGPVFHVLEDSGGTFSVTGTFTDNTHLSDAWGQTMVLSADGSTVMTSKGTTVNTDVYVYTGGPAAFAYSHTITAANSVYSVLGLSDDGNTLLIATNGGAGATYQGEVYVNSGGWALDDTIDMFGPSLIQGIGLSEDGLTVVEAYEDYVSGADYNLGVRTYGAEPASPNDPPVVDSTTIYAALSALKVPLGLTAPTDPDGDALLITVTTLPTRGTVRFAGTEAMTLGAPVSVGQILLRSELEGLTFDAPSEHRLANPLSFTYTVTDGTTPVVGTVTIVLSEFWSDFVLTHELP